MTSAPPCTSTHDTSSDKLPVQRTGTLEGDTDAAASADEGEDEVDSEEELEEDVGE
jgi:hypothetical protein